MRNTLPERIKSVTSLALLNKVFFLCLFQNGSAAFGADVRYTSLLMIYLLIQIPRKSYKRVEMKKVYGADLVKYLHLITLHA